MKDLKDALDRDVARLPAHPAWSEIEARAAIPRLTGSEPETPWTQPPRRRRVGAIALAGTLAVALVAGLITVAGHKPGPQLQAPVPDVVRITCLRGDREQLASDTVAVQPDGVHFEISQGHPGKPSLVELGSSGLGYGSLSVGFTSPRGVRSFTVSNMETGAGYTSVGCFDRRPPITELKDFTSLHLVDPTGLWVSTRMRCDGETGHIQYSSESVSLQGVSRAGWARALLRRTPGLRPTDVVEPAGFPDAAEPTFRAVRNGSVIARYQHLRRHGRDFAVMDSCQGIGDFWKRGKR